MAAIAHGEDIEKIAAGLKKPLKKLGIDIVVEDSVKAAEGYRSGAYYDPDTRTVHLSREWGNTNDVTRLVMLKDGSLAVMDVPLSFDRAVTQTVAHEIAHADSALVKDSYLAEVQRQQASRLRKLLSDTLSRRYRVSLNGESAESNGEGDTGKKYSVAGKKLGDGRQAVAWRLDTDVQDRLFHGQ